MKYTHIKDPFLEKCQYTIRDYVYDYSSRYHIPNYNMQYQLLIDKIIDRVMASVNTMNEKPIKTILYDLILDYFTKNQKLHYSTLDRDLNHLIIDLTDDLLDLIKYSRAPRQ